MKKILILTEEQYPYIMGGGTRVLSIFERYFKENKIEYDIFCPRWKYGSEYDNKRIKAFSIPLIIIQNKYLRQLYKLIYMFTWYISTLAYLIDHEDYDVIFVHENTFSGYLSLIIRIMFNTPIVYMDHSPPTLKPFKDKLNLSDSSVNLLERATNYFRKKADFVIFVSRKTHAKYKDQVNASCYLPNAIMTDHFTQKEIPKEIKNIGYLGRLAYVKNVDMMIRAMKDLPDYNLILIGSGTPEEEKALRKLKDYLQLNNVIFKGYSSNVNHALESVDILLMLWEDESFGISALEAMAKGIPVISADVNEMHHFIGKTRAGICLKKVTINTLIKAINKMKDHKRYLKYSFKSMDVAKTYDYRNVCLLYLIILNDAKTVWKKLKD